MEVRKLEGMLQVAKDKAEAERLAWEEEKEAERREIMELRKRRQLYERKKRCMNLGVRVPTRRR